MFTNTKQNRKVYQHVMLIKQSKTFTDKLYLQNKILTDKLCLHIQIQNKTESLQTSCLQNKANVDIKVMFIKQTIQFTNTICLQNKTKQMFTKQKFTNTLCLYQTENVHTRYVYKTKQYKTKRLQNTLC